MQLTQQEVATAEILTVCLVLVFLAMSGPAIVKALRNEFNREAVIALAIGASGAALLTLL